MNKIRIGHGFDVHRFGPDRKLILGGVEVPYEYGLVGHSDADVLTHAIMDALLGAAGLRDIGYYFPPSDDRFKDADSLKLLVNVQEMIIDSGYSEIINIDTVIMAEKPKLMSYIDSMRENIADVLGIDTGRIGIKATTTERLGFTGRGEGIAVSSVCLLQGHAG